MSISLLILFMTAAISGTPDEGVYVSIWYMYFVGLPMYGILYVGLKLREGDVPISVEIRGAGVAS